MKKIMPVFLFSLFLLVPRQVHAGGAMVGTVVAIIAQIANKVSNVKALSGDAIYYADHLKDVATQIQHAKDQLDKLKEEGERAINNLKGVLDINIVN